MEDSYRLQADKPLTVDLIESILLQQVTLKSPTDLSKNFLPDNHTYKEKLVSASEIIDLAIGLGADVPAEITRLLLLLLADYFVKYPVNNGPAIVSRILEFYQYEVFPQVFTQGLYASPTAHLLLPVFGSGKVYYQGYLLKATDVHDIFSWQPLNLPENLPGTLLQTSFIGLASLLFTYIQFKKVFRYAQVLFAAKKLPITAESFFTDHSEQFENQLEEALTFNPEYHLHLNGLAHQLVKLLVKFGEHIADHFANSNTSLPDYGSLTDNLQVKPANLRHLLEHISRENLILFENTSNAAFNNATDFTNSLVMVPYQTLLNLDQIMAIATTLNLIPELNQEHLHENSTDHFSATYRNQVINVLKEASFAELILKTVTFMYATADTNHDIA